LKNTCIIILNGVGSVGKTSIAKELQNILEKPFLHIGLDLFISMLPKQYQSKYNGKKADEGIKYLKKYKNNKVYLERVLGNVAENLFLTKKKCMLLLAKQGFNLIIDDVIIEDEWNEYLKVFKKFSIIKIGVFGSLDDLVKRESKRKDRPTGLVRGYFDIVHLGKKYDLKLNTSKMSAKKCAQKIKESFKKLN
jgi:chloramphenicol 3-O phosphotransferase